MDDQDKSAACERLLREYGFTQCHVTLHGGMVRIQAPSQEFPRFFDTTMREHIVQRLKNVGFLFVSLDLGSQPILPSGEMDPP